MPGMPTDATDALTVTTRRLGRTAEVSSPISKAELYFVYQMLDPALYANITGALAGYRGSLTMIKGRNDSYYIATGSEEHAMRIVKKMNLSGHARGDQIGADIWYDFSRNKILWLRSENDVIAFLFDRDSIDFEALAVRLT